MQDKKIPKVIHLMWFSGDPYPPLIRKCVNSWHDIVPDYKIKLWTGDMIKDLDFKYLQDALKAKKFAFACDVVRAYALYTEGGIYMDSDVFVKRRFDELLVHDFVSFIETTDLHNDKEDYTIQYENGIICEADRTQIYAERNNENPAKPLPGLYCHRFPSGIEITFMASVKGHPFLKSVLDMYKQRPFLLSDIKEWIIGPELYAACAMQYGFEYKDKDQLLPNDMMIYRSDLYNRVGKSAFALHVGNISWRTGKRKSYIEKVAELVRIVLSRLGLHSLYFRFLKYDK